MICIYCGGKTHVTNSRQQKKSNSVWRRRECLSCQAIFTSVEKPELTTSMLVNQRKNAVEPFSRDKLLLSIYDSLQHRKTALSDAKALTDTVINKLLPKVKNASIDSSQIADFTYTALKRFDRVASVHYRAFHQ